MKVVLIKDFEGYGTMGTVIEVKDGFARNYLIPRGIALPATESNLRHVQSILQSFGRKKGN
jgi:large subunit ribosomal protein L9